MIPELFAEASWLKGLSNSDELNENSKEKKKWKEIGRKKIKGKSSLWRERGDVGLVSKGAIEGGK